MAQKRSQAAVKFGDGMRRLRMEHRLTQMNLADITGIHFTNIARIERGEVSPTLHAIIRIATALEVCPGKLLRKIHFTDLPGEIMYLSIADFVHDESMSA